MTEKIKSSGQSVPPNIPRLPTQKQSEQLHLLAMDVREASNPIFFGDKYTPDKQNMTKWSVKPLKEDTSGSFMRETLMSATSSKEKPATIQSKKRRIS